MISVEQKGYLRLRGYRVVYSDRAEGDAFSVEFPTERDGAFLKHYSHEVFVDQEDAWVFAWNDHISRGERVCAH